MRPHAQSRSRRWLLAAGAALTVLAGMLPASATASGGAAPARQSTISSLADHGEIPPGLQTRFAKSRTGTTDFWVSFSQTIDTSGAREIEDWAERGQYVVDRLREAAEESQADTIEVLDASGVDYTAYWVTNAIRVESGDVDLARQLVAEPEVDRIFAPVGYEQAEPVKQRLAAARTGPNAVASVEWGIQNVKADQVWEQYGVRGDGIVVASIDSGVQFDHPALVESYRGNNGDGTFSNDYNWFDAAGTGSAYPTDGHGHGTHTMGTMVGDDGGANQIGVAPGATWIAANGCCPSDQALIDSAQWMLAPTRVDGSDPDPAMRPNIVNNSWGTELPSNDPFMEDVLTAWADAGIFGMWSNGNEGSACSTSGSPGSRIVNYSAGAYDSTNTIASFSSRGPGQDGEIKPNISAPGVSVRSSLPGNQYGLFSGTSMASPHVAGAVALLWSADPSLIGDVDATRQLLDDTATDTDDITCGGTADDNNVYGEGRLDVLALVESGDLAETGSIAGTVTHDESGDPVSGAMIRLAAGGLTRSTRTEDDGTYTTHIPAGDYQAKVSAFGYETMTVPITVTAGQTTTTDIKLTAAAGFSVAGTVVDERTGRGILDATITIAGSRFAASTTGTGEFTIEGVPGPGRYVITIDPPGSCNKTARRSVSVTADLTLPTLELARYTDLPNMSGSVPWGLPYGYSCAVEPTHWAGGNTPVDMPAVADRAAVPLELPFTFSYFGQQYRRLYVSPYMGRAAFEVNAAGGFDSARLYVFDQTFWRGYGEAIFTRVAGTKPNRRFTVEWRDYYLVPPADPSAGQKVTFALTLHEDGDILYSYQDLDPDVLEERGSQSSVQLSSPSPDGRAGSWSGFRYAAREPVLSDTRQIRFELPPNGFVAGHVVDKVTGKPVPGASVELLNRYGTRLIRKTTDANGAYRLQLMTGRPYTIRTLKTPAYQAPSAVQVKLTDDRETRRLVTRLHGGRINLWPGSLTLRRGAVGKLRLTNSGDRKLRWWATRHAAGETPKPGTVVAASDVTSVFPDGLIAVEDADGTWWASGRTERRGPVDLIELDGGYPTGNTIDLDLVAQQLAVPRDEFTAAEMAWLPDRDWLCLFPSHRFVSVISCVDPETSRIRANIPTGYSDGGLRTSVGLAYDPDRDLFQVAISERTYQTDVRTLAGVDHPEPGARLHTCRVPYQAGGLSFNPASRSLWFNTRVTDVGIVYRQLEPMRCHVMSSLPQAYLMSGGIRAADIDENGNFLVPHQGTYGATPSTIVTMQTSEPAADRLSWLRVSAVSGTLDPHRAQTIRFSVDWDAVPDDVTGAKLVLRGSGGGRPKVSVPITLRR